MDEQVSSGFIDECFYRAFEERYYAPREVILSLRKQYLPFAEKLVQFYPKSEVYDIGCGRGEWLELMQTLGFVAFGVDLDDGMLAGCYEKGLHATQGNGVSYLSALEDNSQAIVSAFHVVEHLSFYDLQIVIKEALRVLKPGGLLILEMPNIENFRVASSNFYLDPTHVRPIPVALLSFLTENFGFSRTKVLRLQENPLLHNTTDVSLLNVLTGVSCDCAVIAQKQANQSLLQAFDKLFDQEYGITLEVLAEKYDFKTVGLEKRLNEQEFKLSLLSQQYDALLNSYSWRITKPLRLLNRAKLEFFRGVFGVIKFAPESRPRRVLRVMLIGLKAKINTSPRIKGMLLRVLSFFPGIKLRLKRVGGNNRFSDADIAHLELTDSEKVLLSKLQDAILERKQSKEKA